MSPRSLRLLETSLVAAFVSFGVAAAALHASEPGPPAPVVVQSCEAQDEPLQPLLRAAVEADAAFGARTGALDEAEASRVEALYAWYITQHDKRAGSSTVEWARSRAAGLRQLQDDLQEMRKLEAMAKALEQKEAGAKE